MIRLFGVIFLLWFGHTLLANGEVKAFTETLTQDQKTVLDSFLRTLVQDQLSGYVLFGDKPICIEACPVEYESGALSGVSRKLPILSKGMELWQDLKLSLNDKEYIFLIFDVDYGYRHLICINRRKFLQIVNENITLFRYVLGPTLTAEGLLRMLIEAKERFYEVLKNDNVLLGILLGYGKQNALVVSRKEFITDSFGWDRKESFPFISKKERFKRTSWPKAQEKRPSSEFGSLAVEYEDLSQRTTVSCHHKPFDSCKIPFFGCEFESKESKILLDRYEKNRAEIIKVLEKNDFLEEVLKKLFTTTSNTLDVPSIPSKRPLFLPSNSEEIGTQLAIAVVHEIKTEKYFQESFLTSFLQGIKAREKNALTVEMSKKIRDQKRELYEIQQDLESSENLERCDSYFSELDTRKNLICILPGRLYYNILQNGEGPAVSRKVQHVSFHYSFSIPFPESLVMNSIDRMGSIKEESVEHFIPGVALALIGMKRGEEREIYIHPEYGYDEEAYLPPNAIIIAKIKLVDFTEGNVDLPIFSPHQMKRKSFKKLLKRYEALRGLELYQNGADFWDFMKSNKNVVDFETFKKCFDQVSQAIDHVKNIDQKDRFLRDLHWYLLSPTSQPERDTCHNPVPSKNETGKL